MPYIYAFKYLYSKYSTPSPFLVVVVVRRLSKRWLWHRMYSDCLTVVPCTWPRPAMYSTSKLQARNASLSFLCYGTSCASQCTITIIRTNSHVSLELRAIKCFFVKFFLWVVSFERTNELAKWTSYVRLFVRSVVSLCFLLWFFYWRFLVARFLYL